MKPDGTNVKTQVLALVTEDGEKVESAPHPKQVLFVEMTEKAAKNDILRIEAPKENRGQ